jgi:hypothetical protein
LGSIFDIQQGDYLKNHDTGETYFIASAQDLLPIRAIKTISTVTVSNGTTYGNSGTGFEATESNVAVDVPCYIEQTGSSSDSPGYVPSSGIAGVEQTWTIYLWDPSNVIKNGYIVTDSQGNRGQVKRVHVSDIGTKLIVGET